MDSLSYCYWTLGITVIYLFFLLIQKRYRLLLPSVIHTFMWMITAVLIICQLKGFGVSKNTPDAIFCYSTPFICALIVASVIGFSLAHITTANIESVASVKLVDTESLNNVLNKFRWIPYTCGIVGIVLTFYFVSTIGSIDSLHDYRINAIMTKRVGYAAIVQRISGHINILGGFYLMILGYKQGKTGINLGEFIKYVLLCSAINLSIGGRVWLLTSSLPFLIAYFYSRKYAIIDSEIKRKDKKYLLIIVVTFISLFSIIGMMRSVSYNNNFLDKFLYLTDGSRMTNLVLSQYPEGSYSYEYGASTLAQSFIPSEMTLKFAESISYDIGLSVTVKSVMPYLYYDFGFWGGAVFWCLICFFIEYICIRLKYRQSILSILVLCQLSGLLFQAPVGHIFNTNIPAFEWLIIIYIFRNKLFYPIASHITHEHITTN